MRTSRRPPPTAPTRPSRSADAAAREPPHPAERRSAASPSIRRLDGMKLFNRGNDPKAAPPAAPAGPAAAMATPATAAAPAPAPAAAPAPAPAAPAAPPVPELTAILDANVKDMSEKIAKLASTVESQTTEKGALEAKLEQMEERMRKLSSLTEMISAQYN